jgi:hypothetical protein
VRVRVGAAALLAIVVLALAAPTGAMPDAARGPAPAIELVEQTPVTAPGGSFVVRVRLSGVPDDGSVRIVVHQRVRSRSELAQSMEGEGLRSEVFRTVTAISSLPAQSDGSRRLTLSFDPASGGLSLSTEGVYPIELIAQDAAATPVATLVTHLIVPPAAGDEAPSLGVAVVADVGAPPALQPDGTVALSPADVADMAGVVAGLSGAPATPVSIAARPETIDALLASTEPGDAELVAALRQSVAGRTVLSLPYVEVSPDALAPAGLLDQLGLQTAKGRLVLTDELGVEPIATVSMSPPALGAQGLAALAGLGVHRVVVADDQIAPLEPGIISYSLAQSFVLTPPEGTPTSEEASAPTQALATDAIVLERLSTPGSPGLVTSRVLAELALLRLEQPSVARSMVLPLAPSTPAGVVQLVLEGLAVGRPFAPMSLDEAFDHARPLLDGGDNPVDLALLPATPESISADVGRSIEEAQTDLATFTGLVGRDSPTLEPLARHLLVAMATGLSEAQRRAHATAVESAIDAVSSQVSTPATFTLTLAARDGTVPLTIQNGSGTPLHVAVHLRSQKLEFPEGETIPLVLTQPSTRIDIPVRARTSGAFPLQIDVTTPDGQRRLAMSRYTVRSTAVSGAGLVLSLGAGIFLVVWWARHWHRTRRSARLVAAGAHPAAAPEH